MNVKRLAVELPILQSQKALLLQNYYHLVTASTSTPTSPTLGSKLADCIDVLDLQLSLQLRLVKFSNRVSRISVPKFG